MSEKILSIFIDESGDFGSYETHSPYYIVSMILHDQSIDISENICALDNHVNNIGYNTHAIHIGPLIRRESVYINDLMENRKKLFSAIFNFARRLPFNYICTKIKKSECIDVIDLTSKLSKSIATTLNNCFEIFKNFDRIIVYYDNGQVELTKILTSIFNALFFNVEFRKVRPADYKLFQIADLVCTLELLNEKRGIHSFSRSELEFFHSERDFNKNYYKWIERKRL